MSAAIVELLGGPLSGRTVVVPNFPSTVHINNVNNDGLVVTNTRSDDNTVTYAPVHENNSVYEFVPFDY